MVATINALPTLIVGFFLGKAAELEINSALRPLRRCTESTCLRRPTRGNGASKDRSDFVELSPPSQGEYLEDGGPRRSSLAHFPSVARTRFWGPRSFLRLPALFAASVGAKHSLKSAEIIFSISNECFAPTRSSPDQSSERSHRYRPFGFEDFGPPNRFP